MLPVRKDKSMQRIAVSFLGLLLFLGVIAVAPSVLSGQGGASATTPPDFSGVYFPARGGGGGARGPAAPAAPAAGQRAATAPPPPTRSAPTGDLSTGRSPNAPLLTPE